MIKMWQFLRDNCNYLNYYFTQNLASDRLFIELSVGTFLLWKSMIYWLNQFSAGFIKIIDSHFFVTPLFISTENVIYWLQNGVNVQCKI